MKPTVPLMMFGLIPVALLLFRLLPPRWAAIATFFGAWMFLPNYTYGFPGAPDYDKVAAASLSVVLATLVFQSHRFSRLKFQLQDLFICIWCLTPFVASLANGLGAYDGFAAWKNYVMAWAVPYVVGRLYLDDWKAFTELAWSLFIGGLLYMPLCWIEFIVSPQLHNWIYGWHPHEFLQSLRGNGYRPVVFMQHGLMVGMWMTAASLAAIALWRGRLLVGLSAWKLAISPRILVCILILTTIACKSMGALALLIFACLTIELARRLKSRIPLNVVIALPAIAIALKLSGLWTGQQLVDLAGRVSEERAASLEFRLINEEMLVERALESPVFGWGGWGRSRIFDEDGKDVSVTDAYWIIVLGTTGIFGVTCFAIVVLLPSIQLLRRIPPPTWKHPQVAVALSLALLLPIYLLDCLFNDMKIPFYMLIAGGLTSILRVPLPSVAPPASETTPPVSPPPIGFQTPSAITTRQI